MDDNKFTKEQENALKSDETSVTNEKMDSYEKEAAVLESISLDTNTMAIDEEFMNKQDKDKKDIGEKGEKETSFFKRILEGIIDQTVVLLLSLAAFFISFCAIIAEIIATPSIFMSLKSFILSLLTPPITTIGSLTLSLIFLTSSIVTAVASFLLPVT